jgi:hypothetical protein
MGVHVALTGFRGLLMPLLGWLAYEHLGWQSFIIALVLAFASQLLFQRLAARDEAEASTPVGATARSPTLEADVT